MRRLWLWLSERQWAALFITVAALAILVLRVRYPEVIKIDAISIALIGVAVLPWLRSIVKSVEVAGLGKLELQDVERAARKVEDAGLPKRGPPEDEAAAEPEMNPKEGAEVGGKAPETTPESSSAADSGSPPEAGVGPVEPGDAPAGEAPTGPSADYALWWKTMSHNEYKRTKLPESLSYDALHSIVPMLHGRGILTADDAYVFLDEALTELAAEYGLRSASKTAAVRMLKFLSVLDDKQADAVLTAFNLLTAARNVVTSRLAESRAVDVALEVADSLNLLRTRAIEKRKMSERLRSASTGTQGGDAAGAEAADSVRPTNLGLPLQKQQRRPREGEA